MKKAEIYNLKEMDYTGTEALNAICSNLSFAGKDLKKIVFTSCSDADGKSFLTMQIAVNMAQRGKRVVLIDAELRRSEPAWDSCIRLSGNALGIAHYLAGQCAMEDVMYETNIPNACLIPAGCSTQNPIPLLNSPDFLKLLDYCGENIDLVLIDAAPIGLVIDAAEIARYCDGAVLIAGYRKTRARELTQAKQQIEQANSKVIGCIINGVTLDSLSAKKNLSGSFYSRKNASYFDGGAGSAGKAQKKRN